MAALRQYLSFEWVWFKNTFLKILLLYAVVIILFDMHVAQLLRLAYSTKHEIPTFLDVYSFMSFGIKFFNPQDVTQYRAYLLCGAYILLLGLISFVYPWESLRGMGEGALVRLKAKSVWVYSKFLVLLLLGITSVMMRVLVAFVITIIFGFSIDFSLTSQFIQIVKVQPALMQSSFMMFCASALFEVCLIYLLLLVQTMATIRVNPIAGFVILLICVALGFFIPSYLNPFMMVCFVRSMAFTPVTQYTLVNVVTVLGLIFICSILSVIYIKRIDLHMAKRYV